MRLASLVLLAMLPFAGCSSEPLDAVPTTRPPESTTTTAAVDEPGTSAATTSTPAATSTPSSAMDTNQLAEGSGCTPGDGALPDGSWFGYVEAASAGSVDFDLACWFTGDAANAAALEDGETEVPVPNDYYVRNQNRVLRSVPVADGAKVVWLEDPDPSRPTTSDYLTWRAARDGRTYLPGVWLTVAGGEVTEINEQYVP